MTDIFTLGIKADTTDIDKGSKRLDNFALSSKNADDNVEGLRNTVNTAGKAIATFGVAAAAALGAITVAAGNSAREIENLARVSNDTVENFQRAAFAAKGFGIEQDKLADILKDTQDKVGDFLAEGGGELAQFFKEIAPQVGITAEHFKNLSGKDALQLYVSTLEKANISQTEMTTHMERIASDSTLLLPLLSNNGKEFERLAERADTLGLVLSNIDITNLTDMDQALNELAATSEATSQIIGATLAPFVTDLTNAFNDNAIAANVIRDSMVNLVGVGVSVTGVFSDAGRVFEIFGTAIAAAVFSVGQSFSVIDEKLELAGITFDLFFAETGLALTEWVNEQEEGVARWAESMVNALDVFDLIDDVEFEINPLDTSGFEDSILALTDRSIDLEDTINNAADNIGNAWQDVLDIMAEPLPSEGLDEWFGNIKKVIGQQNELQKTIKSSGKEGKKTSKIEKSSSTQMLSNFKEITKGAQTAFGERTGLAEDLWKVQQAIAFAEQAMILTTALQDTAATGVHVANSGVKATANGVEAVTAAFAAPWPIGFAAGAAMIGIIASVLGGSGGGGSAPSAGGGGGSTPKTSSSIENASELILEIEIDQLSELRGIRAGLNDIGQGTNDLARLLVGSSFVISTASFSLATGSVTGEQDPRDNRPQDEAIREIRERLGVDKPRQAAIDSIFENISSTFTGAVDTLGLEMSAGLDQFVFSLGAISLKGLDFEESVELLNNRFSLISDNLVSKLLPGMRDFQIGGENLFETLIRVTNEQVIFNDTIDKIGLSLGELSSIMQIEVAQSIINLTGGIENFTDLTQNFFSEFFTEAEQFEHLSNSVNDVLGQLGLTMFESRDDFRAMVEGIDITTIAGQELFAALLELNPAMDELFDTIENNKIEEAEAAEEALANAREEEAKLTNEAARQVGLLNNELKALAREMQTSSKGAFKSLTNSIKTAQKELQTNLRTELTDIGLLFDQRRSDVQGRVDRQVDSMNNQLNFVNNQVSELGSLSGLIAGSLNSLIGVSRESAKGNIRSAISAARGGQSLLGKDLAGSINALTNLDSGEFGSQLEFQREQASAASSLTELKGLTDGQLSAAEQTVSLLENQILVIGASADRQIDALNIAEENAKLDAQSRFEEEFQQLEDIKQTAQDELNAVLGIESSVLSIADAQIAFNESIKDLAAAVQAQATAALQIADNGRAEAKAEAERLVIEQRQLNADMNERLTAIAITSAKTAKTLGAWDGDGQPEVRNVS